MPFGTRRTHRTTHATAAPPRRRGLFSRRAKPAHHNHHATPVVHETHVVHHHQAAPVHHQKRHASIGDKISGALLKLRGSLTRRPGMKAAGTRRMHGTDGRGSRRSPRLARRRY